MESVGIAEGAIRVVSGNSMSLTAANFTQQWQLPSFRMFSVDGGHSLDTTLHDLMVATCVLRDGGIVILDDVSHPDWIGVTEALVHFSHAQSRLVPFLMGFNKVWFTTASHVELYLDFVRKSSVFNCSTAKHPSRRSVAGHIMCFSVSSIRGD